MYMNDRREKGWHNWMVHLGGIEIHALHRDRRQAHSSALQEKENLIWSNCLMKGQGPPIHGCAAVGEETQYQSLIPISLMSDSQELCNWCNGRLMQGNQLIPVLSASQSCASKARSSRSINENNSLVSTFTLALLLAGTMQECIWVWSKWTLYPH